MQKNHGMPALHRALALLLLLIALPTFAAAPGGLSAKERDKATPTATETSTPNDEGEQDSTATATSEPETVDKEPTATKTPKPKNADPTNTSAKSTESRSTAASGPLAFPATSDGWAEEANPEANNGTTASIKVDGAPDPVREGYLQFAVSGVTGRVTSAHLRLYVMAGTATGPSLATVSNDW